MLIDPPKCKVCDNLTNYSDRLKRYKITCSKKCNGILVSLDPNIIVKKRQTCLTRYGVEHHTQNKKPKEKSPTKKRYLEQPGVENPQKNKEIRLKTKATNIERYGQDGFNPKQLKKTNLERYGVEYPIQNPVIFEKVQRSQVQARYKYKSFITTNGRTIWYQGYEKYIIEYLFDAGIVEADLLNDRYQVPVISYTFENKNRKYFPDIFIKSKNMLIEVKSSYTFDKEIQKNLAKQKAAKEAGYHHIIIIWSVKDNHIDQII